MKSRTRKKLKKFYEVYQDYQIQESMGGLGGCLQLTASNLKKLRKMDRYWEKIQARACHRQFMNEAWARLECTIKTRTGINTN